jgi:hypothetical protein
VKTSAVRCLAQCITTYLRRFAPSTASADLLKWLTRAMSGIIGQLKRASFPSSEQQARLPTGFTGVHPIVPRKQSRHSVLTCSHPMPASRHHVCGISNDTTSPRAQQALIQQLLVDVSRHVPAFALELLAVQVLNEPTNLEMSTIGLRSLRAVVLSPPMFSRDKVQPIPLAAGAITLLQVLHACRRWTSSCEKQ